jgi:hypothetical protein
MRSASEVSRTLARARRVVVRGDRLSGLIAIIHCHNCGRGNRGVLGVYVCKIHHSRIQEYRLRVNDELIDRNDRAGEDPYPVSAGKLVVVMIASHSLACGIVVGLTGLAISAPVRTLTIPYVIIDSCVLVLLALPLWAHRVRVGSRTYSNRVGITMFGYVEAVMLAMGFGAIRLGIMSRRNAFVWSIPSMMIGGALASIVGYLLLRRLFEGLSWGQPGRSGKLRDNQR